MTSFVIFILIGSTVFSLVFRGVNGDLWVEHLLTGPAGRRARLPDRGQRDDLLPRVLPRLFRDRLHHGAAARAGGAEARHRPGLVRRAARRSTCRPRSCIRRSASRCSTCAASRSKEIKTTDIYWGAIPFVCIQVLMVAIVIAFPGIVTSHVSKAAGAISGSGADEIRRQLEAPGRRRRRPTERCAPKPETTRTTPAARSNGC